MLLSPNIPAAARPPLVTVAVLPLLLVPATPATAKPLSPVTVAVLPSLFDPMPNEPAPA